MDIKLILLMAFGFAIGRFSFQFLLKIIKWWIKKVVKDEI